MTSCTRIKICGLRTEADVEAAVAAGADAVGFMLYERSARFVTPQRAGELARGLPPFVTPVLVTVNDSVQRLAQALDEVPNALVQFHGDEDPARCEGLARPYLRALAVTPQTRLLDWRTSYPQACGFLLDAPVDGYGGGGKVFDWSLIGNADSALRLVLSGGLNAANVAAGIAALRPWAVDVSSGVERERGVKDAALMHRFCQAVREADASRA
jgi:phosphoribosylanthranilate isomerase